jgi:glucose-6-phosphate isomerase
LVNKILLGKSSSLPGFGDWVEQLVAESTGKNGHGMLPVVGSNLVDAPDCVSVGDSGSTAEITITGTLGEQMFLWLVATTFASKVIGVNPFDQPNVESAKVAARALLDGPEGSEGARGEDLTTSEVLSWCQSTVTPRSYLALCVFGDTTFAQQWSAARSALEATINRPVTLGLGPQFLHSTGQFHKGGPLEGVFLQVIQQGTASMEVPGRDFDFGQLMEAQADGDSAVLTASTQPTKTVVVSDIEALEALFDVLLGSKA